MCGRYYLNPAALEQAGQILEYSGKVFNPPSGDICPSQASPVFYVVQSRITMSEMNWGFPGSETNKLIINARAETLMSKPLFRESARLRRCVIPAHCYYETNPQKEKVSFSAPDQRPLFLAGIYNLFNNQNRFVVITTAANDSVCSTHHRMPLILSADELEDWLYDASAAAAMLTKIPAELHAHHEYHQQTLFDLT